MNTTMHDDDLRAEIEREFARQDARAARAARNGKVTQQPPHTTAEAAIRGVVLDRSIVPFDKRRRIAEIARDELAERGSLLCSSDGRLYYFDRTRKRLYDLTSEQCRFLLTSLTGLTPSESYFRFVLESLCAEAARREPVEVQSLAHFDSATGRLAVSDGGPGYWVRERGGEWERRDNGDDGTLFATEAEAEGFEPDFATHNQLEWFIDQLTVTDTDHLSADDQRILYTIWLYQQFFPTRRLTRIIPAFLGPQGSGKTTAMKRTGRLLLGRRFEVAGLHREKEDAFIAAVANRVICALDNADSRVPWLEDALATYATGMRYRLRKLYTTNDEVSFAPRAVLMLSSRDPHFKRPDVAERLLPLHFERPAAYVSESTIFDDLERRRGAIIGELLTELGSIADMIDRRAPGLACRMADFAEFGWLCFERVGKADAWVALLKRLEGAQAGFAASGSALVQILALLLSQQGGRVEGMSAAQMYSECAQIAERERIGFYRSPLGFGQALTAMRQVIETELGVKVFETRGHARTRYISLMPRRGEVGEVGDGDPEK